MTHTRRATRLLAALALTATPIVTVASSHTPVGAAALPAPPVIKVVMGDKPSDMTVDTVNPRRAGRVTFDVTTTKTEDESDFQIAKLAPGATIQQVIDVVSRGLESDQPDLGALRQFERMVTLLGGVNALPGQTASVTLTLLPGVYYLVDTTGPAAEALPVAKRLEVRGPVQATSWPATAATVDMRSPHVFSVDKHLPADGTILVRNSDDEPHFLFIEPIPANATDSLIQSVFDRVAAGDESAFDQLPQVDGPRAGTGVISPGYQTLFTYHLTPGLYMLGCFWPDAETGMPHAFMGMHKVVSIG